MAKKNRQPSKSNEDVQGKMLNHHGAGREVEESVRRQIVLNTLLQLSLEDVSLQDLLDRFIDHIISFPGLGLSPSGLLFLKEEASDLLLLKAHSNVSEDLLRECSQRKIGDCLCGQAALTRKVIYSQWPDRCHEITYQGMQPHGHYCIPILAVDNEVLGVLTIFLKVDTLRNPVVEDTLVASANVIAGIIERKKAERALREKIELLSSIYAAANSVALITTDLLDDRTRITSFSPGAEGIFGYSSTEVVGQPITCLGVPENAKIKRRVLAGQKIYLREVILSRKSGELFPASVTIHPLTNGTRVVGSLGVCLDISDLKLAQAALKRSNEELEDRVEERTLELQKIQRQFLHAEKLSAIGRLSASIAHEFNNPMQGVMSVLNGIVKRVTLEDEDMHLVRSAIGECNRMKSLIRDLQGFNRPSSGQKQMMDLREAIDSLLLFCKSDFKQRKITVVKAFDGKKTPIIMAVPDQIRQVILNLLNNAADACPDGGTVNINVRVSDDTAVLNIKDTGVGIKPENMDCIFEPFYTTKPEVKGTGLGLSVCHGIIRFHKGHIQVESQPGKGSTFTVTLPVRERIDGE